MTDRMMADYLRQTDTRSVRIVKTRKGSRRLAGVSHLSSNSVKDCAMTRGSKIGRERVRAETQVSITAGSIRGADNGLDNHYSRAHNRPMSKNARRKLIRQLTK